MLVRFIAVAACGLFMSSAAQAADITVLSVSAVKEIVVELLPQFEKTSGHKVSIVWSGSENVKKRVDAGETYDLVIVGAPLIDGYVKAGKMQPGSRVDFVKSGIGVAVKAGAPKPDIGSAAALKNALLAAKSVAYSTGASGVHIQSLIEKFGISEQMKTKSIQAGSGQRVGDFVAKGEAQIGFQQISELLHEKGIDYVGPLSADTQKITVYSSGIHSGAKQTGAAKALQAFLTAPAHAAVVKKNGMDPAAGN